MAEVKKTATTEEVIQKIIGIKPGASLLTPIDYGETERCMIEYSNQVNAELLEACEGLTKYFAFMIKDPNFHEYKEAIAAIKRARKL